MWEHSSYQCESWEEASLRIRSFRITGPQISTSIPSETDYPRLSQTQRIITGSPLGHCSPHAPWMNTQSWGRCHRWLGGNTGYSLSLSLSLWVTVVAGFVHVAFKKSLYIYTYTVMYIYIHIVIACSTYIKNISVSLKRTTQPHSLYLVIYTHPTPPPCGSDPLKKQPKTQDVPNQSATTMNSVQKRLMGKKQTNKKQTIPVFSRWWLKFSVMFSSYQQSYVNN